MRVTVTFDMRKNPLKALGEHPAGPGREGKIIWLLNRQSDADYSLVRAIVKAIGSGPSLGDSELTPDLLWRRLSSGERRDLIEDGDDVDMILNEEDLEHSGNGQPDESVYFPITSAHSTALQEAITEIVPLLKEYALMSDADIASAYKRELSDDAEQRERSYQRDKAKRVAAELKRRSAELTSLRTWLKRRRWNLEVSAAVSMGQDPIKLNLNTISDGHFRRVREPVRIEYLRRLHIFKLGVELREIGAVSTPRKMIAWATKCGIEFPAELTAAAPKRSAGHPIEINWVFFEDLAAQMIAEKGLPGPDKQKGWKTRKDFVRLLHDASLTKLKRVPVEPYLDKWLKNYMDKYCKGQNT